MMKLEYKGKQYGLEDNFIRLWNILDASSPFNLSTVSVYGLRERGIAAIPLQQERWAQ